MSLAVAKKQGKAARLAVCNTLANPHGEPCDVTSLSLSTDGIYIAIRKIRPGLARFFCSYAGHVWKHGNLSTDAGGSFSTGGKVAFWRSALGTIGIYVAIRKKPHGRGGGQNE